MTTAKLRPEDLTAEERAFLDSLTVIRVAQGCEGDWTEVFRVVWNDGKDAILARRALFAPAPSEAAIQAVQSPVCPNCWRDDTGHAWEVNGKLRYSCASTNKPAQPEPAVPEMPHELRNAVAGLRLAATNYSDGSVDGMLMNIAADRLDSWWRNSAQLVKKGVE